MTTSVDDCDEQIMEITGVLLSTSGFLPGAAFTLTPHFFEDLYIIVKKNDSLCVRHYLLEISECYKVIEVGHPCS